MLMCRKIISHILIGIKLPSLPVSIIYFYTAVFWLLFVLNFMIIPDLMQWKLKTSDFTTLNCFANVPVPSLFWHILWTNYKQVKTFLVFHRKDLCDGRPKTPSVFKFSDVLFVLESDGPPVEASSGHEQYYIWSSWPQLRCTPLVEASSGQEWYYIRSAWHFVNFCVRLTFCQMYPPGRASSGQE